MKLGLVVLNYNDAESTVTFLNHIKAYKRIDKIVVVDNCSPDDSFSELKKMEKTNIDVIRTDENRGYAAGNNFGVRYLSEKYSPEYIIISNPDVLFDEAVIDAILEFMERTSDVGAAGCRMNCLSSIALPIAWKLPRFRDCLIQDSYIIKKIFGDPLEYTSEELKGEICKVDVLPGSMFAFKTDIFNQVGGFDEHTFLYYEENILAYKLKNAGFTNYLINNCSYDHMHSVSIDKNIASVKKRFELAFKSRLWYCRECLHANTVQIMLLYIFYKIGIFNYLIYKKITG